MGAIFSKKKSSSPTSLQNCEITEQDQAILQLKTQRDKMKQMIKRKEKCMEKERELAKQLITDGRKDRALLLLKKKRYQETVIEKTLKQLDNIEKMVNDLEFAGVQMRVLEGLKQGNEALKKMNAIFDIDEIDKIMDETREAAEYQEEISNLISGQLSTKDIADVEMELDALLAAQIEQNKLQLPDAPTDALQDRVKGKESQREKDKVKKEAILLEA